MVITPAPIPQDKYIQPGLVTGENLSNDLVGLTTIIQTLISGIFPEHFIMLHPVIYDHP